MIRSPDTTISGAATTFLVLALNGLAADAATPAQVPAAQAKILVLTGNEYPGHKWRETAPLIAKFLAVDPRMTTEVNADPAFLAPPELGALVQRFSG